MVQPADVVVPALGLSEKLVTAMAVLAILGFPVALALAWAFDVTPEALLAGGGTRGDSGEHRVPVAGVPVRPV